MGDYAVMSYAANASIRATMAYDVNSAHIYYPTGDAKPPFAGLAIVPGFTAAESSIAAWAPFLASRGIIVMTIGTSNPSTGAADTSVQPPTREAALLDALTTIKGENTRSGSPLNGKVDVNRMATAGWSMGGGGTMLAATATPSLKASMAMCPWNPGADYSKDTVPSLQFGGTTDGLAGSPMPDNQYNSVPMTTSKLLYVIQGGSHFVSNDPKGEGAAGEVAYAIGRIGLSWMKVFLECDVRYKQFLTKPADASEFMTTVK
jgi:dienelactone hydrolase